MKSLHATAVVLLLGAFSPALAQNPASIYGTPALMPAGQVQPGYGTNAATRYWSTTPAGSSARGSSPLGASVLNAPSLSASSTSTATGADDGELKSSYMEAMSAPWGDDCTSCGSCGQWFAGAYGLIMTRDRENFRELSFDTTMVATTLLGNHDASMGWDYGLEARFGRVMDGGRWAWEVVYWGVFGDLQEANAFDPDGYTGSGPNLSTALDLTTLDYDNGAGTTAEITTSVNSWYDGAARHRLRRDFEFHNVELNLMGGSLHGAMAGYGLGSAAYGAGGCAGCGDCNSCSQPLNIGWVLGVRFFKFEENYEYASADQSLAFGVTPEDDLFYNIDTENNLIGVQLGGRADYRLMSQLNLFAEVKFGLYGNHITHHSRIGGQNGAAIVNGVLSGANPNAGRAFDIRSTKNVVSFLGEFRLGGAYQISPRWKATGGYRAVAVTGVALPDNQIPANFSDIDGVVDVYTNGSLILHGAYAGLEFVY